MSKPPITLSLNPSYLCNFRCSFCYLTEQQLKDKTLLPLERLSSLLEEISLEYCIEHIDLYGGEPSLLPKSYLEELMALCLLYVEDIHVNTNLSSIKEIFKHPVFKLCVSFDFNAREKSDLVLENLKRLDNEGIHYSISTLVSQEVLKMNTDKMCEVLSTLKGLNTVELKPYSPNQSNQYSIGYNEYEDFLIQFIQSCQEHDLHCTNVKLIKESLSGKRNAFSDDHLYITPNGMAVLEFDLNDNEFFLPIRDIKEYKEWVLREKSRVKNNPFCSQCQYFGRCLSEHLREVKDLKESCNGFYHLLNYYHLKGL